MFVAGASITFAQDGLSPLDQHQKEVKEKEALKKEEPAPSPGNAFAPVEKSESTPQTKTEEMDAVVKLSDKQKSKIEIINKEQNEKMKKVRMSYKDKEDKSGRKKK